MDNRRGRKTRLRLSAKRKKCHLKSKAKSWKKKQAALATDSRGDPDNAARTSQDPEEPKAKALTEIEVCMQIKDGLKKLRRKSDSQEEKVVEPPVLELEVFPDKVPHTEFVDESLPEDAENEKVDKPKEEVEENGKEKTAIKRKIRKDIALSKKIKRNPRRLTVLKREQAEAIKAAQNAPGIEKVYLDSGIRREDIERENPESRKENPASSLDYKEQLYEFGKYVAEQLISFDEKDAKSAQNEIKEVLGKYRLKYKIMQCLSKPGTSNVQPAESNCKPKTAQVNCERSVTKSASKGLNVKKMTGALKTYCRPMKMPNRAQLNQSSGQSVLQIPTQDNSIPVATQSRIPEAVPKLQPLSGPGVTNSDSLSLPLSFVIVPSSNPPGFQLMTERVNANGTTAVVPQYLLPGLPLLRPSLTQPILTQPNVGTGQPVLSQVNVGTAQPVLSQINVTDLQPSLPNTLQAESSVPSLPHVKIGPVAEPGCPQSEFVDTPVALLESTHSQSQIVGVLDMSKERETLIVKSEPDSGDESE